MENEMIKIRRVKDKDPATTITHTCLDKECPQYGSHYEQWRPDLDKQEFSVAAHIAAEAVSTGYFEQVPESRAKLKSVAEPEPLEVK